MFEKQNEIFPIKSRYIYLAHCSISPLYSGALSKEMEVSREQMERGRLMFDRPLCRPDELREAAGRLLRTEPANVAFVKNTSEGLCMIANGYPFERGDQIISYVHEYPANHYPWKIQEARGVELILLPNRDVSGGACTGSPCGWTMTDLMERVTPKTRIIALSHVQFTSGYAADLKELGSFCRAHRIDLVVDVAQSLGCLPVYPEDFNIAALAASGWKWLLGPVGTGLFYTSEALRDKLAHVMVGADLMVHCPDYLDHSWNPFRNARRFEYSTSPESLAGALEACISDLFLRHGVEDIRAEVFRLQDTFMEGLDRERFTPIVFPDAHRSGILSLICRDDPASISKALEARGVICTPRAGYLRVAPHFYNTDEEVRRAASLLNSIEC